MFVAKLCRISKAAQVPPPATTGASPCRSQRTQMAVVVTSLLAGDSMSADRFVGCCRLASAVAFYADISLCNGLLSDIGQVR